MADPATDNDGEAVQILRRLEPVLTNVDRRLGAVEADVKTLSDGLVGVRAEVGDVRSDVAELHDGLNNVRGDIRTLDSRVSRVEGQLSEMSANTPTIWTIATLFAAINAVTVALGAALARLIA